MIKKKNLSTEYIISWRSKGVCNSRLDALNSDFLPNIKKINEKIVIQFNNIPLFIEQNNYTSKTVNVYIVYDFDNWQKHPLRNFALKNCFFGANNIVKNNVKEKYVYSGYRIAFDGKGSWSFNDDFARSLTIFGVDNNSLSHTDNVKNGFLILGEGDTFGINESFGALEKSLILILVKQRQSFV